MDVSQLNLDIARTVPFFLLALHEVNRPNLGKIQGPALNAEIWPRAPITRFPILVVEKGAGKRKQAWRTLVLLGKRGELLQGGEDFEAFGCSVK